MPVVKVEVRGKKFHVLVDGKSVLETESQGDVEQKLKDLRKKVKVVSREPKSKIQDLIDDLTGDYQGYISDWDSNFVSDIERHHEVGNVLTPLQIAKLEEIFERAAKRMRDDK